MVYLLGIVSGVWYSEESKTFWGVLAFSQREAEGTSKTSGTGPVRGLHLHTHKRHYIGLLTR